MGFETSFFNRLRSLSSVWIGSDNKQVIDALVLDSAPPWECAAFVLDIKRLNLGTCWSSNFVSRRFNNIAH